MGYRIHLSDITEEETTITVAIVVRTADNITKTYGGGYVVLSKANLETDLDAAVQKIVAEGDRAFKKKLTAEDRAAMKPVTPVATGTLLDLAYQKNLQDRPGLGRGRGR